MKKVLAASLGLACAMVLTANAAPGENANKGGKNAANPVRKELIAKYDANKDGKLDKTEHAAMTPEDKAKWAEAMGKRKGAAKGEKQEGEKKDKTQ